MFGAQQVWDGLYLKHMRDSRALDEAQAEIAAIKREYKEVRSRAIKLRRCVARPVLFTRAACVPSSAGRPLSHRFPCCFEIFAVFLRFSCLWVNFVPV